MDKGAIFHMGVSKKLTKDTQRLWKRAKQMEKWKLFQKKLREIHEIDRQTWSKEKQRQAQKQKASMSKLFILNPITWHTSYIPDAPISMRLIIQMLNNSIKRVYNMLVAYKTPIWMNEYKQLKYWYFFHMRRRYLFRTLITMYLSSLSKKTMRNIEDPCTLMIPVEKILCIDVNQRCCYQFEARSIQKMFTSSLGYNDWLFPVPLLLKNPLTNIPFHAGQLVSIIRQLRFFNRTSWMIEAGLKYMSRKDMFRTLFMVPLQLYGIKDIIRNPSSEVAIELFDDFVYNEYEHHGVYMRLKRHYETINWAIKHCISHDYIQSWLSLFERFEITKLIHNEAMETIHVKSLELIRNKDPIIDLYRERHKNTPITVSLEHGYI